MSHFTTPLIVINLGCEMLYVIEQRLRAQEIAADKSERVLTDITSVLLHPKLMDELFTPQPVATHSVIKQLLQDISATSIMKLDDYSMNKLWDLMTMIFKWQLSIATTQTIFDITRRHLKSVATLLPNNYPKVIIEIAMRKFEDLAQKFTDADYNSLRSTMIIWFSEYHAKISVLLRLGLQKKDGTFSLPSTIPTKISENLGENIYKYDSKRNPVEEYETKCSDTHEISCLLAAIESVSSDHKVVALQLPVEFSNTESTKKTLEILTNTPFEDIKTNVKKIKNADLSFNSTVPKSAQEDLLDLIDTTESN